MLRIRLARVGKKGRPSYRIVVAEAKAPRDGSYLEWIGTYDPMQNPPAITLKQERALHWLRLGAQASDPVQRILDKNGVTAMVASPSSGEEVEAEELEAGEVEADTADEPAEES